ncbi:MAG: 50S ribosomal protein L29 [Methanosarcinales archaeon]
MARLRPDEIRNMSREEQNDELLKLESELVTERALASAGGAPERPGRIREIRRAIARIKTIQRMG